jgi:hypothetical protein
MPFSQKQHPWNEKGRCRLCCSISCWNYYSEIGGRRRYIVPMTLNIESVGQDGCKVLNFHHQVLRRRFRRRGAVIVAIIYYYLGALCCWLFGIFIIFSIHHQRRCCCFRNTHTFFLERHYRTRGPIWYGTWRIQVDLHFGSVKCQCRETFSLLRRGLRNGAMMSVRRDFFAAL